MGVQIQITQQVNPLYGPDADVSVYLTDAVGDADKQIREGLPKSADRISQAQTNEDYYAMRNRNHVAKREAETDIDYNQRAKQCSRLTRKAVNTLSRKLYSPPPTRAIEREEEQAAGLIEAVEGWLLDAYKAAKVDTVMATANRKAILNDCCAIQIACTGDPDAPVKFYTFGGDEFEVFCHPSEPTKPWGVVTISVRSSGREKKKRTYTFWTDRKRYVYETDSLAFNESSGAVKAQLIDEQDHTYGVIPFVFIHNEDQVDSFWGGGLGTALQETNAEVDRILSDLSDNIRVFLCPDMFARNVSANWRYEKKPGRPQRLQNSTAVENGDITGPPAEIFYLQPQLNVAEVWEHITNTTQTTFFDLDVPLSAVRSNASSPTSGLQVLAEQIPLLDYLKDRQRFIATAETDLCRTTCLVAGNYYGVDMLVQASTFVELDMTWPQVTTPVPTPERSAEDEWRLKFAMASPIDIIQQQYGVTREQAIGIAKRIKEDRDLWEQLYPDETQFGQGSPIGTGQQGTTNSFGAAPAETTPTTPPESGNESDDEAVGA